MCDFVLLCSFSLWKREIVLSVWILRTHASIQLTIYPIHWAALSSMLLQHLYYVSPSVPFSVLQIHRERKCQFFQASAKRGHNGISTARRGCSAIHANRVCIFPSRHRTKDTASSIKKVSELFNFALRLQRQSQREAARLWRMRSAVRTKPGFHPKIWGLNNVKRWWKICIVSKRSLPGGRGRRRRRRQKERNKSGPGTRGRPRQKT